jgi:hypothetical protein
MLLSQLAETRVAIIDDVHSEVQPIIEKLEQNSISARFFDASPEHLEEAAQPIHSIELIFLDLHYNTNFNSDFQPELCAQIIESIVPPGKNYILVVWTRDPDKAEQVTDVLRLLDLLPVKTIIKSKNEFQLSDDSDVERLLAEIDSEITSVTDVIMFDGEIVDIEEDSIIVDCLMDKQEKKFQLRRFDRRPIEGVTDLSKGKYLTITVTTKPGSTLFEFSKAVGDLSGLFSKAGYMDGIDERLFKGK